MAGYTYRYEGQMKIDRSLEVAHMEEIEEAVEEFDPDTSLFADESDTVLDDPYFELHTFDGPF